jgi:hypothetical protein
MRVPGYFSRMTKDPTRNHRIAHDHAAGVPTATLAERYSLHPETVGSIVRKMKPLLELQQGRPIADGMSLSVAVTIEQAIGIWPAPEHAAKIAERRYDIMRAPGKMRMVLGELDAWLGSIGKAEHIK